MSRIGINSYSLFGHRSKKFMSVLNILHYPDERLRTIAKPVEKVDTEIQHIIDDMFETMYDEEGIGLAATQVDIHQRIIVIDVSESRDERLVLINPEFQVKQVLKKVVFLFLNNMVLCQEPKM